METIRTGRHEEVFMMKRRKNLAVNADRFMLHIRSALTGLADGGSRVDHLCRELEEERENDHKHRLFDALLQIHRIVEDAAHAMDKARYTENPTDNLNDYSRFGQLRVEMFDPRLKSAMGAPSLAEFEALKATAKQWESMAESANQTNRAMSAHLQRLNHDMGEGIRLLRLYHRKCGFLMETDKELEMSVTRHPGSLRSLEYSTRMLLKQYDEKGDAK